MKYIKFFGSRLGCKINDEKHYSNLIPKDVNKVIEGFGGSFSLMRKYYKDIKIKKIVNDNDKDWINYIEELRDLSDDGIKDLIKAINEYNEMIKTVFLTKERKNKIDEIFKKYSLSENMKYYFIESYFIKGIAKKVSIKEDELKTLINYLKTIDFYNEDITLVESKKNPRGVNGGV